MARLFRDLPSPLGWQIHFSWRFKKPGSHLTVTGRLDRKDGLWEIITNGDETQTSKKSGDELSQWVRTAVHNLGWVFCGEACLSIEARSLLNEIHCLSVNPTSEEKEQLRTLYQNLCSTFGDRVLDDLHEREIQLPTNFLELVK